MVERFTMSDTLEEKVLEGKKELNLKYTDF